MLKLTCELSNTVVSPNAESRLYLLVSVAAPQLEMKKRTALNIGLTLDRSTSMEGDKIAYCKQAIKFLINQLSADDIFSLVTFAQYARVLIPACPITNKDELKNKIDRIVADGTTNLSGGWLSTSRELSKHASPAYTHRIVLLTDGQANEGLVEDEELIEVAKNLREKKITTSAIGFGEDFNEDLLKKIADAGQGNFHFIDTPEKAPRVFAEELSELLSLYGQNLLLTVKPSSKVQFNRILHDYPLEQVRGGIEVSLGDASSGDEKMLMLVFTVPPGTPEEEVEVASIGLSYYQVHQTISMQEAGAQAKVRYAQSGEAVSLRINPIVERELILCDAVKSRKEAISFADKGDMKKAKEKIQQSIQNILRCDFIKEEIFDAEVKHLKGLYTSFDSHAVYQVLGRKEALAQSYDASRKKGYHSSSRIRIIPWEIIERFKDSSRVTVITGTGLSGACGVPDVHGDTYSLENKIVFNPLSIDSFKKDSAAFWKALTAVRKFIEALIPDIGYEIIASMEDFWKEFALVTETVDGLHKKAGNCKVVELMGNIFGAKCSSCGAVKAGHSTDSAETERCSCGAGLRPDMVLRGEAPDQEVLERAGQIILGSQAILAIGTSFGILPGLLEEARRKDILILEINQEHTSVGCADFSLVKKPDEILPILWNEIKK